MRKILLTLATFLISGPMIFAQGGAQPVGSGGGVADNRMGHGSAAKVIAGIPALRQATEDWIGVDGGELNKGSCQAHHGQLRVLHRNIYLPERAGW